MSSVETGQMSAVETGQMTAAETSVLSQQKTSVLSQHQFSVSQTHARGQTPIWPEMGRESTVWPETWSRSMPGPFRSLWDGSNPLQGAVPGLVLEVQVGSTMSVRAQIIENGPNRVQNRPFGLKLGPEACQDRSGAFGMGLTHSKGPSPAKKVKKCARAAPGRAVEAVK